MALRAYAILILSLSTLTVFSGRAAAEILTYVDESGRTHYVEDPARIPEQYRTHAAQAQLPQLGKVPARPAAKRPAQMHLSPVPKGPVEIYVTSWCPYCKKLEAFLASNNVRYTRYDIEMSDEAAARYQRLGRSGVPVIKIGSRVYAGFNPDDLAFLIRR